MANRCSFDFRGARVLVTGGTSGIGHAIASSFADAGAQVSVTGTRESAAEYDTALDRFEYHQLQMRDQAGIDALAASIGSLDVLVNNAGANFPDGRNEWEPDAFAASLEMNVEGAMRLTMGCHAALRSSTLDGGASVINVVSMTAYRATTIVPGYAASKSALLALTRNLAVHWVNDGIRVNAVAPGLIDTLMTAPMKAFPSLLDGEVGKSAMKRMGTPDEVAAAVLFLACGASAFTTGAAFAIDGGYLVV